MPRNPDWSAKEVDDIVEDYFDMLRKEMSGVRFNKTEHRNDLLQKLNRRSSSSVEMKHRNISAVLADMGLTYIDGYKPLPHKQQLLVDSVRGYLRQHRQFAAKRS